MSHHSTIPTLLCDFYKTSHRQQYPVGTEIIYSTLTPRHNHHVPYLDKCVVFGIQGFVKHYLVDYFNQAFFNRDVESVVSEYSKFIFRTLGIQDDGSHIRELHGLGYLPLKIKTIPEGMSVSMSVPVLTIENTDKRFFWLTNYFETLLSCSTWKPMTSASIARKFYQICKNGAKRTCDNEIHLPFQCHDFSMRGMSSLESAQLSGAGHLIYFDGTDTIPAITWIDAYYYGESSTGWNPTSIPATEHSVMCANVAEQYAKNGNLDEVESYRRLIKDIYPSGFVSIVSDTYDFWKNISEVLPQLKDDILARDGRVVIRPDSGNPVEVICGKTDTENPYEAKGLIECLWDIFGGTVNSKGFKVLNPKIGAIYGDSINLERATQIINLLEKKGFASSNIVFGVGSFTYQYNTRDSMGFAVKATSIIKDGEEYPIFKDPKTDSSKKSQRGRVAVLTSDSWIDGLKKDDVVENDYLSTVFENGDCYNHVKITEVRDLAYAEAKQVNY